jgi:hypothetical protein
MRSRGRMLDWSQQWAQRPTGPLSLAQISYMASGSGSAPAGDGIHLSPLFSHASHARTHTVKGFTRVDPHLVDPNSIIMYSTCTTHHLISELNSLCLKRKKETKNSYHFSSWSPGILWNVLIPIGKFFLTSWDISFATSITTRYLNG